MNEKNEVNGFTILDGHCPACDRVIKMVVGHDDVAYCPICDASHVIYMVGEDWRTKAIKSSHTMAQHQSLNWEEVDDDA